MRAGEKPGNQGVRRRTNSEISCLTTRRTIVQKHKSTIKNQKNIFITAFFLSIFLSIALVSLLTLTISILAKPVTAETTTTTSYCYFSTGDDYTCYTSDTYSGSNFQQFCAESGGTFVENPSTPPAQCVIGCCNTGSSLTTPGNPVSKYYCSQISGNFIIPDTADAIDDNFDCIGYLNDNPFYEITVYYNISGIVKGLFEDSESSTNNEPVPLDSVTIHYPSGDSIIKTITDSDGKFLLSEIPKGEVSIYFERPGCISQEKQLVLENNKDDLEITMNCPGTTCESMPVSEVTASVTPGDAAVTLSWDNPGSCDNTIGYKIYRCKEYDGNSESCEPIGSVFQNDIEQYSFIDEQPPVINSESTLNNDLFNKICYKINTVIANGDELPYQGVQDGTGPNCINPFMQECLLPERKNLEEFCIYDNKPLFAVNEGVLEEINNPNGLFLCDDNTLFKKSDCGEREICYKDSCVDPSVCELCNGIFGFFLEPFCSYQSCYLDRLETSFDQYAHCGFVNSCYDYHTKDACLNNLCSISNSADDPLLDGCEWVPNNEESYTGALQLSSDPIGELGMGVCRPKNPDVVDCSVCDFLDRPCDNDTCSLIGSYPLFDKEVCLFSSNGCNPLSKTSCTDYNSYTACTGGISLTVNVSYDERTRTGGDNRIISPSNDLLGVGLCRWLPSDPEAGVEGRCIKDADGDMVDDCEERSGTSSCGYDHTPPNTTLLIADQSYLTEDELSKINLIVSDDTYAPSMIKTFACMVKVSTEDPNPSCYPENTDDYLWPNQLSITEGEVGTYKIFYYSEDGSGNLEPLKELTVHVTQLIRGELERATLVND